MPDTISTISWCNYVDAKASYIVSELFIRIFREARKAATFNNVENIIKCKN